MLRKISAIAASAAVLGLGAFSASTALASAPAAPAAPHSSHSSHGTHKFTAPSMTGRYNVAKGWGTYDRLSKARVKVSVCVRQTGSANAVGAEAFVYTSGGQKTNIGAVILQGHKGSQACGNMTFLFYTAHLKVITFEGKGGHIIARSKMKTIY